MELFSKLFRGTKYYLTNRFHKPQHLTFLVTRRCNAGCVMCSAPRNENNELRLADIEGIFRDEFFRTFKYICFSGGETFLREDLPDVVDTILKLQRQIHYVAFLTNGLSPAVIEKKMRKIINAVNGRNSTTLALSISFLSMDRETYAKINNVADSYDRVMDTIDRMKILQKEFSIDVRLNTTIQPLNVRELPRLLNFSKKLNWPIRFTGVNITKGYFNNFKRKDSLTFREDDLAFLEDFFSRPHDGISEFNRAFWYDYLRIVKGNNRGMPCVLLSYGLVIDANGELFSCVAPVIYGNVRDENLSDIWNSKKTKALKKRIKKQYCPHCSAPCGAEVSIEQENFYFLKFLTGDYLNRVRRKR